MVSFINITLSTSSYCYCDNFLKFVMSNESPYFSRNNPKFSASNSRYFERYNGKCTNNRYTNFDFLISVWGLTL